MPNYKMMSAIPFNENKDAYEAYVSLTGVGNSIWIGIPASVQQISCTLEVSGGAKAKLQHTISNFWEVEAGSETAVDWDSGEVLQNISDVASPVTAIRLVQITSGSSKLTMRAQ
jgi:hypothetical protein